MMLIEICGKGYLGSYAEKFLNPRLNTEFYYSQESTQYAESPLSLDNYSANVFINLSGPSSVEQSMKNPEYFINAPLMQVKNHIQSFQELENPPHYVFLSSAAVYGDCRNSLPVEETVLKPKSPYAEGKARAEEFLIAQSGKYIGGVTIVRATSVFSEDLNARVLGRIRNELKLSNFLELYGDGSESRDFIHADCLFSSLLMAVEMTLTEESTNVFNIGSGIPMTMKQVSQIALSSRIGGMDKRIEFNGVVRDGDPHSILVSIDKLRGLGIIESGDLEMKLISYFNA